MSKEGSLNDSREAIELLSEKDKKIANLKRQLEELKAKNFGLESCVKNQDSAVRKIGSLVVSPRSGESSDIVNTDEIEDVIDDVYRKIRRMEDIDTKLHGLGLGKQKRGALCLTGQLELHDKTEYGNKDIDVVSSGKGEKAKGEKSRWGRGFNDKVKKAEGQIFASERAFRQISKEKNLDEKILNVRLEQLRAERDTLYDLLKQYEPLIIEIADLEGNKNMQEGETMSLYNHGRLEIEATVTLQDKMSQAIERQELLYHINELRKCLQDIKEQKSRRKQKGAPNRETLPYFNEVKARIDEIVARSDIIRGQGSEDGSEDIEMIRSKYKIRPSKKSDDDGGKGQLMSNEKMGLTGSLVDSEGYKVGKPFGRKSLESMRRLSLTAEKPGVLHENEVDEGNHVTRVLSNRIKELEMQEADNKHIIGGLEETLEATRKTKTGVEKERDMLFSNVKMLFEACRSSDQDSLMVKKGTEGVYEMVRVAEQCIHDMKEELLKSKIKNSDMEAQIWQLEKKLEGEKQEKEETEKDFKELQQRAQENCQQIKDLNENEETSRCKIEELGVSLQEAIAKIADMKENNDLMVEKLKNEVNRSERLELKLSATEEDVKSERENSVLFRNMLQEIEKTKKNVEKDLEIINSEFEKSSRNNSELKTSVQKEREMNEELRRSEKKLEEECEGLKSEIDLTTKEMEDLKHQLKRTKEDLTAAEKFKPILEELQKQHAKLKQDEVRLENNAAGLRIKLDSTKKANDELENGFGEKKKELFAAIKTIDELTEKNNLLRQSEDSLKKEVAALKGKLDDSAKNVNALQSKLNQRNEDIIEGQKEIGRGTEKLSKLREELSDKNQNIRDLQKELSNRNSENEKLQAEIRKFKNEKEDLKRMLKEGEEAWEMELKSLRLMADTLELEKKDLLDRLRFKEDMFSELEESRNVLVRRHTESQEELALAKKEISENEDLISEANDLVNSKSEKLERAEMMLMRLENETKDLKTDLELMNDENEKMKTEGKLLRETLLLGQKEFNGLQKSLEDSWKEKEKINNELMTSETKMHNLMNEMKALEEHWQMKERAMEKLINDDIEKGNKICAQNQTIAVMNAELTGVKKEMTKKEEERLHLMKKLSEKEDQVKNHRAKSNGLIENISQKNEEIDKLRNRIQDIMENVDKKCNVIDNMNVEMQRLKSKHVMEIRERDGKMELFEEYKQSLKKQIDGYKEREMKMQKNGNQMKIEVGKLTDELNKAKMILHDFQAALLDKDNDLKKINDAVMLLENAHATREDGLQKRISMMKDKLEILDRENRESGKKLLMKENEIELLKDEKEDFVKRIKNDEEATKNVLKDNNYLQDEIVRVKRALVKGSEHLGRKEHEVNHLRNKMAQDGREVEDLIQHLDGTLKNVRKQLTTVEEEKINLKAMMENDQLNMLELEDLTKSLKQELKQKDENLMLEKAKTVDLQKKMLDKRREEEDKKKIDELKNELFKMGREKQAAVVKLTRERDEALLQKTSEKMTSENVKLQMKNMKDEIESFKKSKNDRSSEFDKYVQELKRRLVESREKEKEAVAKEADYKLKLKEMSGTVRMLENRIEEAVLKAEEEKTRREEILAQLMLPLDEAGTGRRDGMIDSDKWKERANNLHMNIEDFKDQFSKYKNKTVTDNEAMKKRLEKTRSDEMLNLRKELDKTTNEKLDMQKKLTELRSELNDIYNKRQKTSKDNDRLSEELRLAKQEAMIQKHELDWLRDAVGKYGISSME